MKTWTSRRVAFACAFAFAMLSCGPNIVRAATPQNVIAPLEFWGLTLRQAQDDAVRESPDVASAQAKTVAATDALAAAKAGFGPSLIAGYALNPQAGATPGTTVTQTAFNLGVQATLLAFAQYLPLLSQAEATLRSAQAQEAASQRAERIKTSGLYFSALKARATLQARAEALDLARAQQGAAQKRFKLGDAPRLDVVRAQVSVAASEAATESARAADANATQALALETGLEPSALATTITGAAAGLAVAQTAETAVRVALAQRAEIAAAREDVAAASAALGAARAAALPAVTVSAGYEHGTDTGQFVQGPTINASFELPFNGSQHAHVSDATAALTIAREQLRAQERQVTLEVGSAVRDLGAAARAANASTSARVAAGDELHATGIGYRTGATSSLERTAASATYADARLAELSAIYDEALARAVVELEVGP